MASQVVKAIQVLYNALHPDAGLRVDGVFGPLTTQAVNNEPLLGQLAERVDLGAIRAPSMNTNRVAVSRQTLDAGIAAAVKRFGPEVRDFLEFMVKVENYPDPVSGGVFTTLGGTFQGVAQFSKDTWTRGAARIPEVGSYANVSDAGKSLMLAAWYWRDHKDIFRAHAQKLGLKFAYSPVVAYLYHQQGASAALSFLKTGKLQYPRQSRLTVAAFNNLRPGNSVA